MKVLSSKPTVAKMLYAFGGMEQRTREQAKAAKRAKIWHKTTAN